MADPIGEGGQGTVHKLVACDGSGRDLALKWYFPHTATRQQREAIERLVERGAPGPMFLWPLELVDDVPEPGGDHTFGYSMPMRPGAYVGVGELFGSRFLASLSLRAEVCRQLANAFLLLHAEGMCYRDISTGNVFVDPATADVLICDNDNVGIDKRSVSGVRGTRRYMAPELVRGEASPSADTDLYSLAVLIFSLLLLHHPLLGRRMLTLRGREGESVLLGEDPLFMFAPGDDRNRPDPVRQHGPAIRWEHCPQPLRDLFVTSFGVGLTDPNRRVRESVWRSTLDQLLDDLLVCEACGHEYPSAGGTLRTCPLCGHTVAEVVLLTSGSRRTVLNEGTRLTAHHALHNHDRGTVWGLVVHDPVRGLWGIENTGSTPWSVVTATGTELVVDPGRRAALIRGAHLRVGQRVFNLEVGLPAGGVIPTS